MYHCVMTPLVCGVVTCASVWEKKLIAALLTLRSHSCCGLGHVTNTFPVREPTLKWQNYKMHPLLTSGLILLPNHSNSLKLRLLQYVRIIKGPKQRFKRIQKTSNSEITAKQKFKDSNVLTKNPTQKTQEFDLCFKSLWTQTLTLFSGNLVISWSSGSFGSTVKATVEGSCEWMESGNRHRPVTVPGERGRGEEEEGGSEREGARKGE